MNSSAQAAKGKGMKQKRFSTMEMFQLLTDMQDGDKVQITCNTGVEKNDDSPMAKYLKGKDFTVILVDNVFNIGKTHK